MNILDLFSGCGGLSLGFKQAGFNISCAIDFDKDSIETHSKNFKNSLSLCDDIKNFSDKEIQKISKDEIHLIIGGPPCQGFSNANRWQDLKQDPRNNLFYEFLRFVELIQPKVILIENVRQILTINNGYTKNKIYEFLENLNYHVFSKVFNASNYEVPQSRSRAFIIATKIKKFENLDIPEKQGTNVKDAIGELYQFENSKTDTHKISNLPDSSYRKYLRSKSNLIHNHYLIYPAEKTIEKIKHVKQGENWKSIPQNLFPNNRSNRHSSAFKRLNEKDFSVTIDTGNSHSNYFHPIFHRLPTPRESARLQSFPDNFVFSGSRTSQYRQIGNAVPPLLAKNIAKFLKKKYFS